MAVAEVILGLFMLILSIVTVVGNLAVLLSYYLDKNIRQPTNYFIFSLAISDLLIGLEGIPVYTAFYLNKMTWKWGNHLCDLWLSLDYIVCLASIYTVLGITVDRYYSVKKPALYRNWRTPTRVILIIIFIWLIPAILFSLSIWGYDAFTGKRLLKEEECFVQFMTDPYLNMGMYISYYWTTLFVMLYLYWGIYRAAKTLALKSDQKTKRLALLTEMRRPEVSVRTSDANNSSSDSPNDTSNSRECLPNKTAPPTTTIQTSVTSVGTPPQFRNHMTLHNNNIDHTKEIAHQQQLQQHYSNPSFDDFDRLSNNNNFGFGHQEPSSVIERESTAPCCSPEPSNASHEEEELKSIFEIRPHPHFRPEVSLPFIDADSVSSMVGHDDLRRAMSIKIPNSTTYDSMSDRNQHHVTIVAQDDQQPSTSKESDQKDEYLEHDHNVNEVNVPLIEVSRVESVKSTSAGSKVRQILTAMRSRSVRSKKSDNRNGGGKVGAKKEYKSRSENRARKALRTITFILGSFIILWTPFYVLATIYGFCDSCKKSSSFNTLYTISYYLCYMNSPLNPFCYAMANQQFKKTLTRIFKGDFRRV
ncbi:unnamed protein product [Caenorhabditis angaria]|uniref:G-protein coupled receptors family 1 profile domain-containing protein n=1 Tax=Caenorhabditis angaria TaxID=860376 RepID=A0A9P1INL8_9PELO|nr:unnamed protein product [Caenorhabditis angaria]